VKLLSRQEAVFPAWEFQILADVNQGVIVGWEEAETIYVTEGCNSNPYPTGSYYKVRGNVMFDGMALMNSGPSSSRSDVPVGGPGKGGSMARFTIYSDYLYAVSTTSLHLFDITNLANPKTFTRVQNIGWGIETIFPYGDKLFLGAQNGMHIFDNSNPAAPQHLSTFLHFTACDPVVVEDNYAYVTLRSGNDCRGNINELQIVDISNLRQPRLERVFQMQNPHGLGIDNGKLFICEGKFGLKILDATDFKAMGLPQIKKFDVNAYDVIPYNNNLMMIGDDGFYQYDYSNPQDIKLIGKIPVVRNN
jgi:hypothetical protein